jgi:hypothetical protein
MTRIILGDYHWEEAAKRLKEIPVFDRSHRKGDANQVGVLGEIVIENWFLTNGIEYSKHTERTDFDYIAGSFTIDVKTKDRTVPPKKEYDCSIPLYNHDHQKPDFYLFVSLQRDKIDNSNNIDRFKNAFIVGGIHQSELKKLGKIWRKDQTDPSNGTTFWTDCINIRMADLIPLAQIKIQLKSPA